MQVYKVRLLKGHLIKKEYVVDGCIGSEVEPGKIQFYTRSEAIKKARVFGGKIEAHGKKYTTVSLKVLQLAKSELSTELINELDGREVSTDTTEGGGQHLYYGNVFDTILGENLENSTVNRLSFDVAEEVTVLNVMSGNYDYIMLAE